jgi:uncharacterized caspase-like protein
MAQLFQRRGKGLYRDVNVTLLLDAQATRENIQKALEEVARKAQAQDTLLLFMAGHGVMVGQHYHFIPADFKSPPGGKIEEVSNQGLSADELGDLLLKVPALKRVLILDTCASGGAVELFRVFAVRDAVVRLGHDQGVHFLAAAAATEEAKESEQLGHGTLTYALLAALKAVDRGPLKDRGLEGSGPGQVVNLLEWFSYAADHVPPLTREFCGAEQHVLPGVQGISFPVLPVIDR